MFRPASFPSVLSSLVSRRSRNPGPFGDLELGFSGTEPFNRIFLSSYQILTVVQTTALRATGGTCFVDMMRLPKRLSGGSRAFHPTKLSAS